MNITINDIDQLRSAGVTNLSLVEALLILSDREEPMGSSDLAKELGQSGASVTRTLDRLESYKLIKEVPLVLANGKADRRARAVEITKRGEELIR